MIKKILLFLILFCSFASAITIQGTVYDPYLNVLENSMVTIDTEPKQTMIAKDGAYTFEVPEGEYLLIAEKENYYWEEQINTQSEGVYNLDLVLEENIEIEELPEDVEILLDEEGINWKWLWLGVIALALFILILRFKLKKKSFIDEDDFSKKVLKIMKQEGGRTTQKDIRKKLGVSEAKVSLVIADLESQGKIRKIKKGRGNIIVLN